MGKICNKIADLVRAVGGKGDRIRPTAAIILAGGSSTRMGEGISKQMLELDGMPVIAHTLRAFDESEYISEIIVVAKPDEFPLYRAIQKKYDFKKFKKLVSGGNSRQDSAENGFLQVSDGCKFVAIHDGARCLVTPEIIRDVCREAYRYDAATAATRSTDSVKMTNGKNLFIDSSPNRSFVFLAQTPQIFNRELYGIALSQAKADNLKVTDDNSIIENLGHRVKLVECGRENLKITTKEDITLALAILRARREKKEK